MTRPNTKPKTKTNRRQRKDRHDPKNMNTKALYLMALDYKNINENNAFIDEPVPYSFSNIVMPSSCRSANSRNLSDLLYSNLEIGSEKLFCAYDSAKCYTQLDTIQYNTLSNISKPVINVCIDSNVIQDYLTNIKRRDFFYKL